MPNYAQAAIQVRQNKERRAKGKDSQKPIVKNVNLTRGEILRFYKDEKQVMERGGRVVRTVGLLLASTRQFLKVIFIYVK